FAFQSIRRLAKDKVMMIVSAGTIAGLLLILYTPVSAFIKLSALSAAQLFLSAGAAAAAVYWYEIVKLINKIKFKNQQIINVNN
ncbi:MAG: cation transporting ATPase C-terminal domain-containing protein, partial [Clostridiaceae bacterium]